MSDLNAGRELDALIAEKVMGLDITLHDEHTWEPFMGEFVPGQREDGAKMCAHCLLLWFNGNDEPGDTPCIPYLPEFSADIAAAWAVVDLMYKRAWAFSLQVYQAGVDATFSPFGDTYADHRSDVSLMFSAESDTAPLAICLAALKAKAVA